MLAFSIGVLISKNAFFSKALQKIPKVKSRFSITGKPILGALKDEQMIMIATLMFLAVFYTPKDIFYSTVKIVPIYAVICTLKEILRAKKIYKGLEEGRQAMPSGGSYLFIPVLIATLKGNGSGFAGPIVRFVRGSWDPRAQELVKPSVTTKLCFWSAVLLTLVVDHELIYMIIVGIFITIKLSSILGESIDPFKPLENIIFGILNGLSFEERVKDD